jgi:hypothetical protein
MSGTDATQAARTRIGNLTSSHRLEVDDRGTVEIDGERRVEWWIGAEDRWHLASVEPATRVRQWLVDDMPVVATAMRVPGGEVVHRAYAARTSAGEVVGIEVENTSAVPVGLAFVGDVLLPREPRDSFVAPDGRTVRVVPLIHRTTTVAAIPLDGQRSFPAALPSAAQVTAGWRAQTARGLRMVLPDEQLQHAVDSARAQLLLEQWPANARTLAQQGFLAEAEDVLVEAALRAERSTGVLNLEVLAGLATLWRLGRNDKLADAVAPLVRASLEKADQLRVQRRQPHVLDRVRAQLIDDSRDRCLALVPLVPDDWLGQGLEVHDAPTAAGTLSFAVRWHGARPALLWELEPHGDDVVTLTAPAYDSTWSSSQRRGEALLAPVPPPGGLPKVYGARPGERGTAAPDVGDSYS